MAFGASSATARGRFLLAGHDPQHGRLPGAVRPEHADLRAGEERQGDVRQHLAVGAVELVDAVHGVDVFTARVTGRADSCPIRRPNPPSYSLPGGRDHLKARRAEAARRLRRLRGADQRPAGRLPRLGLVDAEAAPGARRHARVLRALVRERAPRRLHPRRAGDGGLRGRAREGARLHQRPVEPRGDLHAQLDRGAEPDRLRLGPREPRARRRRRDHRAGASRELRPLAVHGEEDRRAVRAHPDRRLRRAAAGRARRDREPRQREGGREQPRLEHARDDQPGREARGVGARPGRDHGRRRGAGRAAQAHRRAGARLRLPRLLVAQAVRARRARARSGAAASCSRRCSRSTSAAR